MSTRSHAYCNDITAYPVVRSAWDAVKREVMTIAGTAVAAGLSATFSALQAISGHSLQTINGHSLRAVLYGLGAAGFGSATVGHVARMVSILKGIPAAPEP